MDGNMILIPTAKPHDDRPKYMQTTEMVSERVLEFLLENQERIRENK